MKPVVKLDREGRVYIPKRFREQLENSHYEIVLRGQDIILRHIVELDSLFGALPDLDTKYLDEIHNEPGHFE